MTVDILFGELDRREGVCGKEIRFQNSNMDNFFAKIGLLSAFESDFRIEPCAFTRAPQQQKNAISFFWGRV